MKKILFSLLFIFSIDLIHSQELTLFDRPNTIIILSMPANENEFKSIFQRSPEQGELNSIVALLNQNKASKNVYVVSEPNDLEKIMKTIMAKADNKQYDEYIPRVGFSVIGHNDNGNFYFPNGSTMKLEDVEKKFLGVPGMFFSCNAKKYGVTGVDYKLTYSEALNVATNMDNIVNEMHDKRHCNVLFDTPRKIATTMIETLNERNRIKYTAKFLGAAGGLTGGFVLLKQLDTPEQKTQSDSITTKQ